MSLWVTRETGDKLCDLTSGQNTISDAILQSGSDPGPPSRRRQLTMLPRIFWLPVGGSGVVVRIAISQAAFDTIARTLPVGNVGFENAVGEHGHRLIWLDP